MVKSWEDIEKDGEPLRWESNSWLGKFSFVLFSPPGRPWYCTRVNPFWSSSISSYNPFSLFCTFSSIVPLQRSLDFWLQREQSKDAAEPLWSHRVWSNVRWRTQGDYYQFSLIFITYIIRIYLSRIGRKGRRGKEHSQKGTLMETISSAIANVFPILSIWNTKSLRVNYMGAGAVHWLYSRIGPICIRNMCIKFGFKTATWCGRIEKEKIIMASC